MENNQDREIALKDVKLYMANDWSLKEETPEYFLLTRNEASIAAGQTHHIYSQIDVGKFRLIY